MRKNLSWLLVAVLVLALDLITKYFAYTQLIPYQANKVLSFFNLTLAFNKGAAFSFLNSASGWQNGFFIILAILISIILIIWLYRLEKNEKWQGLSIALILGGAWGNLYDRIHLGYVIDFLDFHIGNHHWPIFNIADSAISIGAVLMMLLTLRPHGKLEKTK